ncbi:coiled-coil domain-containing protein 174-like isoform X1 [Leptotrombidium deliense]|uniref:Coiled-coil domain-containing protein 174-like isoform X1 n=1 Tax=Leptotrombidium deliense TaxID=299467 RepID=A0A443SKF3_9ACAR|nr:coiled-coil domain-containing protein 174-like isoform X1 [Leptotrombidium deliense]
MSTEKDDDRIFPSSKRIKVNNTSSLFDLKAELLKKKQDAIASKTVPDFGGSRKGGAKWKEIAAELEAKGKDKELKRFLNRPVEPESQVDEELERSLRLSREALERKTKIYEEKMQKAMKVVVDDSDDEEDKEKNINEDRDLVNFDEKVMLAHKMKFLENRKSNEEPEDNRKELVNSEDDEDWVEFTDSLGRTRKCLKSDVEMFKKFDVKPNRSEQRVPIPFVPASVPDELSNETAEVPKETATAIHYQNVRNEEVRELGVGYFQFSKEDEERKQQMKMLNQMREQTLKQREFRLKMKETKKMKIEERLEKIAKKRGIEYKRKPEEVEENKVCATDLINRLISDAKHESIVAKKTEKVRDWDSGKVNEDGIQIIAPE